MSLYDLVIKGGTVIDGLQTPRYRADVAIRGGQVVQIGRVSASDGAEVVDASGKVVAPGFVDLHTHYDSQVFWDPWCTMSGWHGVTSVVIGNCGFGFAPCKPADRERAMLSLSRNEAVPMETMRVGMPWDWETFPEFLDSVDRTPKGVNVMSFVPLSPLYGYVVGLDEAKSRTVTDDELARMCALLVQAMEAGACGLSAQILGEVGNVQLDYDGTPMVTDLMSEREVRAFCRALGSLGRGVAQVTSPLETAAFMARESGRPIIWNALLADGALNQHGGQMITHRDALKRLAELNEDEGVRVFAQALTTNFASEFTFEEYNLADAIPCWKEALLGTVEEKRVKLSDPARRAAMKEVHEQRGGLFGAGYPLNDIKVHWISSDVSRARHLKDTYEGYTVGEIAAREGKHPIDAMLDVAVAGELRVGFATPLLETPPESMREIANAPVALPGVSDGGAHTKFVTTARYPSELLGLWVREHGIMSLEQAHWRLSAYPAAAAGLKGRGFLAEGAPADVIVYDPQTVDSLPAERVWDYPAGEWRLIQKAVGYDRIIVNGRTTFVDGECTEETPGRLLRHGTD
ncbi:N-acyl-D-aspartate/D-glutamate deacylase [Parafrankia irregularis]|uniref:N-acyl-D-aspartate/D-glutamate deacylase n=1 Tax=Parafrankia irregularis TaxID=795642 RepID=A0A0S4QNE4_9ACTN|nr:MULTISPECIES: amidohydrolase family protein [Parafrankia]MBE3200629.1 amidohydrolase family protein [Parafrankia sp. CH37]CUU56963.1 N-acyl-D-aspartate/D-glutamate deacylase [Parafrankia irregularis]